MDDQTTLVPADEATARKRKPRSKKRGGWFVNDAELIEEMGLPEKIARRILEGLDGNPSLGFPPKIEQMGHRRYLPAVSDFFEFVYGFKLGTSHRRHDHAR
jgi:hypothetical protein